MAGRPAFKPTAKQRDRVKLLKADGWSNERIAQHLGIARNTLEAKFATELEFGADAKRAEVLEAMQAAAKKGNASAGRWLVDRFDAARAADQLERRANSPATEEPKQPKAPPPGKKELQQQAAERVGGKFAPPAPPKLVH